LRGLFDLHDALSPRMDVAVEQLLSADGFLFREVWFHRDGDVLRCDSLSPWHASGLHDAEALSLMRAAADVLQELVSVSPAFAQAIAPLTARFAVIADLDISWAPVVELVADRLVWQRPGPLG